MTQGLDRMSVSQELREPSCPVEVGMKNGWTELTIAFASGCFGGLTNGIAVWLFGVTGITAASGVQIAPAFTLPYLYQKVVWGGIWGPVLLLPLLRESIWARGILLSLGPTFVQLFIVFPFRLNKGLMGLELGQLTPLFVFIYNAIWGVCAVGWMRSVTRRSSDETGR